MNKGNDISGSGNVTSEEDNPALGNSSFYCGSSSSSEHHTSPVATKYNINFAPPGDDHGNAQGNSFYAPGTECGSPPMKRQKQDSTSYGWSGGERLSASEDTDGCSGGHSSSQEVDLTRSSDEDQALGFGGAPSFSMAPSLEGSEKHEQEASSDESHPAGAGLAAGSVATDFLRTDSASKPQFNPLAAKMMAKMGYVKGKGLGKDEQGRVNIVEASKHRGRRGLGRVAEGFEPSNVEWALEKEQVSAEEQVEWMPKCEETRLPSLEEMETWIVVGPKKLELDDEMEFCSENVLRDVLSCKSVFDNLEDEELRRARTKCNPYETIRGVFFQNRAAMKMANMDAVLDFMFTEPKDSHGRPVVAPHELLYFADVCAGPGGFSEYVLWRKKCESKGFGFTLKGPCDFKLEEFLAAPSEMFEPHYGKHDDGNIYNPENLVTFREFVLESTEGRGVHFVMADGGFSVEGQENIQEILSKRLYLCQFLCALSILRPGGHFVCKLFDVFTPFSVGVVYLMYRAFDRISIFKPVTSRPANSERYIVCQGKRSDTATAIHDYMFAINLRMEEMDSVTADTDIQEVVPLSVLQDDENFFSYICSSNEDLGVKQAVALVKIKTFAQNSDLVEPRQKEMREECLRRWKIPDEVRTRPDRPNPEEQLTKLLKGDSQLHFPLTQLEPTNLDKLIKSVFDYRCVVSAADKPFFLLSSGRSNAFKKDGTAKGKWVSANASDNSSVKLDLPQNTLLEAEFVQEFRGEGKGQRRVMALHVIDAMFLCGDDIRELHFNERVQKIKKFVKAITRPTRSDLMPIRVKEVYRLEEIQQIFDRLDMRRMKAQGQFPRLCYCCGQAANVQNHYITPVGVYFIKMVKDPWSMCWSKSQARKYFYNQATHQSEFNIPIDSIAHYRSCLERRLLWRWEEGVKVHETQKEKPEKLSKDAILQFVQKNLNQHHYGKP